MIHNDSPNGNKNNIDTSRHPDMAMIRLAVACMGDADNNLFLMAMPSKKWVCYSPHAIDHICRFAGENANAKSVYYAINPVGDVTSHMTDADVIRRRWILVDIDRNKTHQPDDPATDGEHDVAIALGHDIAEYLALRGFPSPIITDSGNGCHLYYRIDLPNDAESKDLVRGVLAGIDAVYADDPRGDVGVECHDAKRFSRLPGTWSRRGTACADRPYRHCSLLTVPDSIAITPLDALQSMAAMAATRPTPTPATPMPKSPFLIRAPNANTNGYVGAALAGERDKLAHAPVGARNNTAYKVSARLHGFVASGHLDEATVEASVLDASAQCGLPDGEARKVLASGRKVGLASPAIVPDTGKKIPPKLPATPAEYPAPLPLTDTPDVSEFPLSVFAPPLQVMVEETSAALNVPQDYAALPMLTLEGGAIGNSRHISLSRSHSEPPELYSTIVGPPGTLKTPVFKILRKPFDEVHRAKTKVCHEQMDAWDALPRDGRGPKPVLPRVIANDATTETLALVLHENPRGIVLIRDEASGLMTSMNQYKGGVGADKQFFLSAWAQDAIYIDRKTEKSNRGAPLHVALPFLAIVGGIQPDVLPIIAGDLKRGRPVQDGFIDRFAFAWPDPLPHIGDRGLEISAESIRAWDNCIHRLLSLEMVVDTDDHLRPYYVQLDQSGRDAWRRFTEQHANEMNADTFPRHLVGPWAKLRGMTARIALILHLSRWACGDGSTDKRMVDGLAIHDATRVTAYLKDQARRVHACMGSDPRLADAKRVLSWIRARRLEQFTRRDACRQFPNIFRDADDAGQVLDILVRHYIVAPVEMVQQGAGRRASPAYVVNPRIYTDDA